MPEAAKASLIIRWAPQRAPEYKHCPDKAEEVAIHFLPTMSPPQTGAHVNLYNKLPLINEAYAILRQELKADPSVSNDKLMLPVLQDPEVRSLFCDGIPGENDQGLFDIWIVHRHFALEMGERMVSTGNISTPTPQDSTHFADRWDLSANEIEFVRVSEGEVSTQRAPSGIFAKAFQELMSRKFGVSCLGLCLAPSAKLPPGFFYLETIDTKTRSQIVEVLPTSNTVTDLLARTYRSTWSVLDPDNNQQDCEPGIDGDCQNCEIKPACEAARAMEASPFSSLT